MRHAKSINALEILRKNRENVRLYLNRTLGRLKSSNKADEHRQLFTEEDIVKANEKFMKMSNEEIKNFKCEVTYTEKEINEAFKMACERLKLVNINI